MGISRLIMDKFIYVIVLAIFVMMCVTIALFSAARIDYFASRVYLEALTGMATLALLFYAYSNTVYKREEDTARLELAVRPILAWEIFPKNGGALLTYRSIKHPIYDLHTTLSLGDEVLHFTDRHVDVYDERFKNHHERDISDFVKRGLGSDSGAILSVLFACHSEVGGRYEFQFSKEVVKEKKGYLFYHRKLVSAKYPWKSQKIAFTDEDS